MNTLWVFGDSFAENHVIGREHVLEQQWHRIISRELKLGYQNFGLGGSSLDYTYHNWHRMQEQIVPGDLVIMTATGLHRRWLHHDSPWTSTPNNFLKGFYDDQLDSIVVESMRFYYRYLDHEGAVDAKFYNWLCCVDRVAARGVKLLILPVFDDTRILYESWRSDFPHTVFAEGDFVRINHREHDQSLIQNRPYDLIIEGRCNHMCVPNHWVLAQKILAWYRTGEPVDLNRDFYQDLIKSEVSDDPSLFAYQHVIKVS